MKIHLIAIGQRVPLWVTHGFDEYSKRLPNDYVLQLHALPAEKRSKSSDIQSIMNKESESLLIACPSDTIPVALDRQGKQVDTQEIAKALQTWHDQSQNIALLVGGPEGISDSCLAKTQRIWSLSKLTLPHPLVRVLVAEQIYRAWSILSNHPYHR